MSAKNLNEIAQRTQEQSTLKWKARISYTEMPQVLREPIKNKLKAVPNTWCKLVNTMVKPCPKCKKPGTICSRWHLKYVHNLELKHINKIWRDEITPISTQEGANREDIKKLLEPIIQNHLQEFAKAYACLT
jgi:hypothetical protein